MGDESSSYWSDKALAENLDLLAAPASAQIQWVQAQKVHVDELALMFDDEVKRILRSDPPPSASPDLVRALEKLNAKLGSFSGSANAELWTTAALTDATVWEEVRALARDARRHVSV